MTNIASLPFDPLAEVSYSKSECQKPLTEVERRQEKLDHMRASYNESLRFRVSSAQIADRDIVWTPTILNRDATFQGHLPRLIVTALRRASEDEKSALETYFTEALNDPNGFKLIMRQGVLPSSLSAHFPHPLRGGGKISPKNICLMTAEAKAMLKNTRITQGVQDRYNQSLTEIQKRAARYLADPERESLPRSFIKTVSIGCPEGIVCLNSDDLRLHRHASYLKAESEAIEALKRLNGPQERRPFKPQSRRASLRR